MRTTFIQSLTELAHRDPRIVLLTGDLGFNVLEPFKQAHPTRFFNVGVAEQNMVGIATGLAEAGFIPFVYSITTFAVLRPFEFIRNGPVAHGLPVRIVGIGCGVEYGHNGITHYALEDIGVLRTMSQLTLLTPCDSPQASAALHATWDLPGPVYYRLSKDETPNTSAKMCGFEIGRAHLVTSGDDVLFIAMGSAIASALGAVEKLRDQGKSCSVLAVSCIQPAPMDDLLAQLSRHKLVITVEAHAPTGGLGSLVCEVTAEHGLGCKIVRRSLNLLPAGRSGGHRYMERNCGLDAESLATTAMHLMSDTPDERTPTHPHE